MTCCEPLLRHSVTYFFLPRREFRLALSMRAPSQVIGGRRREAMGFKKHLSGVAENMKYLPVAYAFLLHALFYYTIA